MDQMIIDFATQHPSLASVLVIIGSLRLVFKPLFAAMHSFAQSSGNTKLDQDLTAVETSQVYTWVSWLLDYVGSIKLAK